MPDRCRYTPRCQHRLREPMRRDRFDRPVAVQLHPGPARCHVLVSPPAVVSSRVVLMPPRSSARRVGVERRGEGSDAAASTADGGDSATGTAALVTHF
jgi:hypothetical protein